MASLAKRLPTNAPGEFFVDASCIDCDACRWIAPETFDRAGDASRVHAQPEDADARRRATLALVACPTGSIGGGTKDELRAARDAFPVPLDGETVLHCGWHSRKSFGAASWLLRRPAARGGNVLVDSPRFSEPLARRLEALGGVATMFLSHADDVADHARFAERFGCRRVLHERDVGPGTRDVEVRLSGEDPVRLDDDLVAIPTPGHTEGSTCLLHAGTHLFTGDHLAWSERLGHPYAFRSACWYDWGELVRSMERLAAHRFAWILPGHGRWRHLPHDAMARAMERCLAWVRAA